MSELHALFGGTFDPIHFGHLRPVEALAQQTGLQRVTLLPNNVPPHRPQPEAVTTLEAWRAERGAEQPLAFIIGQDSLLSLSKWHRWQDLLSLCHLLVCQRPGYPTRFDSPEMKDWLDQHLAQDIRQLHQHPAGHIWLAETPLYDISATEIRRRRHQNQPCDDLLPAAVIDYIDREGLYRD